MTERNFANAIAGQAGVADRLVAMARACVEGMYSRAPAACFASFAAASIPMARASGWSASTLSGTSMAMPGVGQQLLRGDAPRTSS
jgi:hypothetical protein